MTKTICPNCGTIRTIDGTPERVRCPSKDGCGVRYYTKNNIVPEKIIIVPPIKEKGTILGRHANEITLDEANEVMEKYGPMIDDTIKILFDNLDKSITSVWGPRPNGKNKWDAKYNMWLAFRDWAIKQIMGVD